MNDMHQPVELDVLEKLVETINALYASNEILHARIQKLEWLIDILLGDNHGRLD